MYHCDIDVVVPSQAGQQFRQRLGKVLAAFVSQCPDYFLILLVMLVQWIFLDLLLQLPKMLLRHFARVQLQQYHVFTTRGDYFPFSINSPSLIPSLAPACTATAMSCKLKLAIMCQCTSVTDRRTDRLTLTS